MFDTEVLLATGYTGVGLEPTGVYDDHVLTKGTPVKLKYFVTGLSATDLLNLEDRARTEMAAQNLDITVLSAEQTSNYAVVHCVMNSDAVPGSLQGIGGIIFAIILAVILAVAWIAAVLFGNVLADVFAVLKKAPMVLLIAGGVILVIVAFSFMRSLRASNPLVKKRR